jgi:dynein heavy chain
MWGAAGQSVENFYHWIASDKEIVKSVLLLTGSVEGTKAQVMEYIDTFKKFDFLYLTDLQSEYAAFMATEPSLEAFENELKKYMAVEEEIAKIAPVHNIGAMSLETQPMKNSLKSGGGDVEDAVRQEPAHAGSRAAPRHPRLHARDDSEVESRH